MECRQTLVTPLYQECHLGVPISTILLLVVNLHQFGTLLLKAMNAAVEQLSMFGPNKQAPMGLFIFYQTLFKPSIISK